MLDDHQRALRKLSELFEGLGMIQPIFVTDWKIAFMNAVSEILPRGQALLCCWYANKNIFTKQWNAFSTIKAYNKFTAAWNCLMSAPTEKDYERQLKHFEEVVPVSVIVCLTTAWQRCKNRFVSAWLRYSPLSTNFNTTGGERKCRAEKMNWDLKRRHATALQSQQWDIHMLTNYWRVELGHCARTTSAKTGGYISL